MANANRPSGLAPVKYLNGADWDGRGNIYYIASTDTNLFSVGDAVKLSGDGDPTRGIPGITRGTAGATAVGVLLGVGTNPDGGPYVDPTNLTLIQAPATKLVGYYALIADDPNIIFEMQEGGAGTVLNSSNIGENINFIAQDPSGGSKLSGFVLDNANHDTTSTRNCKLLGLVRRSDNAFGANSKWLVTLNNHAYRVGITGV